MVSILLEHEVGTTSHIIFCMVTYGHCAAISLGLPHPVVFACTCAHTIVLGMSWGLWPPLMDPLERPQPSLGSHRDFGGTTLARVGPPPMVPLHADSLQVAWVLPVGMQTGDRSPSQLLGAPIHMSFHSLSLQGSDLTSKSTTSVFPLYFDKH